MSHGAQDGPKRPLRPAQRAPRGPQDDPKRAPRGPQEGPKRTPRGPQEDPKRAPRWLQETSDKLSQQHLNSPGHSCWMGWWGYAKRQELSSASAPSPLPLFSFIYAADESGQCVFAMIRWQRPRDLKRRKKPLLSTNFRANGWVATEGRRGTARWPHPTKRGALKPPRQKCEHHGRSRDSLERCD